MTTEIDIFRQVYRSLDQRAPEAPSFDELGMIRTSPLPKTSRGSWRSTLAWAALTALVVGLIPLVALWDRSSPSGGATPWFTAQPDGHLATVWLSRTPGELIVEVDGIRLVGSAGPTGVAPFDQPEHPMLAHTTAGNFAVTGASTYRGRTTNWAVITLFGPFSEVVFSQVEPGVPSGDWSQTRSTAVDGVALGIIPLEGVGPEGAVIHIETLGPEGEDLGSLFIRPNWLEIDVRCVDGASGPPTTPGGSVATTVLLATTTTIAPNEIPGEDPTFPLAALPLRLACPFDQPR